MIIQINDPRYVDQLQSLEKARAKDQSDFEDFSHRSADAQNTLLSLQVDCDLLRLIVHHYLHHQSQKQAKEQLLNETEVSLKQLEAGKAALESELGANYSFLVGHVFIVSGSKTLAGLTESEKSSMHSLTSKLRLAKEALLKESGVRSKLQEKKDMLVHDSTTELFEKQLTIKQENKLLSNLLPRQSVLKESIVKIQFPDAVRYTLVRLCDAVSSL